MSDQTRPTFRGHQYSDELNCLVDMLGTRVQIRPKSLSVFRYLAKQPGKVVSKDELLENVWAGVLVTDDVLVKSVGEIRQILGDTDRTTLQTISGRGYLIESDLKPDTSNERKTGLTWKRGPHWSILIFAVLLLGLAYFANHDDNEVESNTGFDSDIGTPTISFETGSDSILNGFLQSVEKEARIALSRYKTVILVDGNESDFVIRLSGQDTKKPQSISMEMIKTSNQQLVFAQTLNKEPGLWGDEIQLRNELPEQSFGVRIAGIVASPGGGLISRILVESSRNKKVEDLSQAECYALGYDCTNCSGELDSISEKAKTCLAKILLHEPENARAWGLQSTIYAHQYQWSSTLPEPERTNHKARSHLPVLAIEAANKAEQFSNSTDTSVYWGMAQAYGTVCEIDKLRTVIDRGLQINPNDPSLLAAFGSWLAYSGNWDDGVEMVKRAMEIEPRYYKRWWLFPVAKRHYALGEYELALKVFRQAYNERNWLSHLQLAYTLPHFGENGGSD